MNILALLLKHKLIVSLITLLIGIWVLWGVLSSRPATIDPSQAPVNAEQHSKMKAFKSGHYRLSKGKTW